MYSMLDVFVHNLIQKLYICNLYSNMILLDSTHGTKKISSKVVEFSKIILSYYNYKINQILPKVINITKNKY